MRLTSTFVLSLLLSFASLAQTGSYYLAQYDLEDRGFSNFNYDIVQDNRGLIYMANLQGVVVSDGLEWSLIETPYSVFSLDFDENKNLFVGGRKEIAVIENASQDADAYRVISKVKQQITEIQYFDETVYFLSENTLYQYTLTTEKLVVFEKPSTDIFLDIILFENAIYIVSASAGIQEIKGLALEGVSLDLPENIQGIKTAQSGAQFLYTTNGEYYTKKEGDQEFSPITIDDDGYLEQNIPVSITWVNDELLAVSTISGGVVFINASSGKVEQYMNYENGLSDNEVLTLYVSKNNIVWCATPLGVSIIAPEIPIRKFNSYSGLSGKINVVYNHNDRVYVGTSVGLFELVKDSVFEDVVSYKKITKTEEIQGEVVPVKQKKGLFKKKKKAKVPVTITRDRTYYQKQVQQKLLSQNYEYHKIDSVEGKVNQLISYNGKLLIGTLLGIYELNGDEVNRIFSQPIVYMYKPEKFDFLMVSTYNNEVKVLTDRNSTWEETGLLDGLDDLVEQIEQGSDGGLWLCGADSIYKLELSSAYSLDDVEVYPINNPHWERIYANQYKGKTYFINSSGYYFYEDHSIKKDSLLEKTIGLPSNMILSSQDKLWVNTGHFWYGQGQDLNNSLNFISLFEDPRYISEIGNNEFWVVAGDNQMYKVDGNAINSIARKFELFLEKAEKDSVALPLKKAMGDIDQHSYLSFRFSSPDFTNIYQTEFQYRLVGLSKDWSEWSKANNEISFPYLPAGSYTLEVKARDALGNVRNSESISFKILAPYWKRSWFYLIELLFFGGLMTISVLINRNKQKFTILSRLLTFLTLIFIVEFVQTVAEAKFETNHSPVINFFIQVAIALSILPVEGFLRKFITAKERKKVKDEKNLLAEIKKGQ